jgi:hypothetical protein
MTSITVVRPVQGEPELAAPISLAPRAPAAEHLTVGLIANGKPLAPELLSAIAAALAVEIDGTVEVRLVSKPNAAHPIDPDVGADLAAQVDVVIAGLGDCGACSSCSLHDALTLEKLGTPATVLITEPFQSLVADHAVRLGAPGYHALVVPHPVFGKSEAQLGELADALAARAVTQLVTGVRQRA